MPGRHECLPLLAVAGLLATAGDARALDETRCRLEAESLPAALATCARLEVPAEPGAPDGPQLELFFARIPALTAEPDPEPLVLIAGGPGQSTVDMYLQMRAAFEPVRRDRDILLLDQRGTGRSAAGFTCELPDDVVLETARADEVGRLVESCRAELEHDPRWYTTSAAVADLDRLRRELGVENWQLYGVSYGTRVAQHYLRRYGEHVGAVILDGVVPADLALGPDIAPNAQAALDALFARCEASPPCARRFDALAERFATLQSRLAESPVEVTTAHPVTGERLEVRLTENELRGAVRLLSYNTRTAALLPLIIDAAAGGDYDLLAAQSAWVVQNLTESLSLPMHNSVVCTEDVPFLDADARGAAGGTYLGGAVVDSLASICAHWPAGLIDPGLREPVASDVPALVLSGEFDPVTPPAYGERVIADGLANAVHVVGRAQGHGLASVGCVPRLMRMFLETPEPDALDTECLEREAPTPFFLSRSGPAP